MDSLKRPLVSVIMSIYEEPIDWLKLSINSILNQTYTSFEFIIICDNPNYKEGISLINHYAKIDERVKVIINDINIGLTKSLNKGIQESSGAFIARMDADDVSVSDRLEKELDYLMSHEEVDVCHANIEYINENGSTLGLRYQSLEQFACERFVWNNFISHSTVFFNRTLLDYRKPFYNEDYRSAQDYELWTFLDNKGVQFGYIEEPLLYYRVSDQQVSRKNRANQKANYLKTRRNYIIDRLLKLGMPPSVIYQTKEVYRFVKKNQDLFIDKVELKYILYLLYFTLTSHISIYGLLYLFDSNSISRFVGNRLSLYVLLHPFVRDRWNVFSFEI